LILFLLAPLPQPFPTGSPHPVRAITMAPIFSIFGRTGSYYLFFQEKAIRRRIFWGLSQFLFIFNFAIISINYYVNTPIEYGYFGQYGNKQAVLAAKSLEGKKYQKISWPIEYDQAYIYTFSIIKLSPIGTKTLGLLRYRTSWEMKRIIGKYESEILIFCSGWANSDTLLIGSPQEIPANASGLIKTIYYLDGSVAYRIVDMKKKLIYYLGILGLIFIACLPLIAAFF